MPFPRSGIYTVLLALFCAAASTLGAQSPDGYTGSAVCEHCHKQIYQSFTQTRMGRSMLPADPRLLSFLTLPASHQSTSLHRSYQAYIKDGRLYQSESATDASGKTLFRDEHAIDWIIGAGYNGYSGLLQRGQFVVEAPLTFYVKTRTWELSPGYDLADLAFNRTIQADCIYCHSARPKPLDKFSGRFAAQPFEQLAIGCENCHGPGAAHVAAFSNKAADHSHTLIVNPENIAPSLDNDICMSCHESGDARIPKPGKSYADFRPGQPLDNALSIFMLPLRRQNPKDTDHVQHYFMMTMSKCYRASNGALRCTTCHDPHVEPTHDEAPAFFNPRCQGCHSAQTGHTCSAPQAARSATTPGDNCIGCHMPRRPASESPHTTLTNHRILARPGEPWPDQAFALTTPELPNLIHLNRVPGKKDEIPPLTLLDAFHELSQRRPEYQLPYAQQLAALESSAPDNAEVQNQLGYRDLQNGDLEKAVDHLKRAIQLDPNDATNFLYLSQALELMDDQEASLAALGKAAALEPLTPALQKKYVQRLFEAGKLQQATTELEKYLSVYPEDDEMRNIEERLKK